MKNDVGPAFPVLHSIDGNWVREPLPEFRGMRLRDWFARGAMESYVYPEMLHGANTEEEVAMELKNVAAFAYRLADAMLLERDK